VNDTRSEAPMCKFGFLEAQSGSFVMKSGRIVVWNQLETVRERMGAEFDTKVDLREIDVQRGSVDPDHCPTR
jgi:hypothetical protein